MTSFLKIKNVILLLILCSSCNMSSVKSVETEKQIVQKKDSLFIRMISVVPKLKLPYTLSCGIEDGILPFPYLQVEDLGEFAMEIFPENSIIVGKLPVDNDRIYILYGLPGDIIYPYLNIYDKNGVKTDSLYLHRSYCTADDSETVTNVTTINKDFSITLTDTIKHIHYIDNEIITDSVFVRKDYLQLMDNGLYKRQKEEAVKTR
ncbi:MAG: hypothetical protein LBH82_00780 [Bacteroidales bacterium]|nr:hypothetical protein [Bacteroidales bacterium]